MQRPESPTEVPAETAYEVAVSKVGYLLTACILAEAQALDLRRQNERLERRCATLLRRAKAAEGVMEDATCTEDAEGAAPVGEGHSAHDFSD